MSEETRITFKNEGGLRISKDNTSITTGKVIVNGIEITSVEDWEKVTQSIVELQQENHQLKDRINKTVNFIENGLQSYLYSIEYKTLLSLLKGDKNE